MAKNLTLKIGHGKNEPIQENFLPDSQWIWSNREALYQQYGKGIIWVYQQRVLGFGTTMEEATNNARANLELLGDVPAGTVVRPVRGFLGPHSYPSRIRVVREIKKFTDDSR